MADRALLIVNPTASGLDGSAAERVVVALAPAFAVETVTTEARGHATALARAAAARGVDVVAVLGGDGTVSEAADGLAGTATALTPLPAGVTNVFARTLGARSDPVAAARLLAARVPAARAVDLGLVNGRHFLFSSGVGLSAQIMAEAEAEPDRKASLGQLHFTAAGVSVVARRYLRDPPRLRVQAVDGRTEEGITVVVQNGDVLTYFGPRGIRVCEGAGLRTGSLSLTVLRAARARNVPGVLARLVTGRAASVTAHPLVGALPSTAAATVTSTDGTPLPVEADGEYLGEHVRVEYGVAPGALRVLGYRPERIIAGSLAASDGRSRRERR